MGRNELIDKIISKVLEDEESKAMLDEPVDVDLYKNRLTLLYGAVLDEIIEEEGYDVEGILKQIVSYEVEQIYTTNTIMEHYREFKVDWAFEVFSYTAYSLAIDFLEGKEYLGLAKLLGDVYKVLVESYGQSVNSMEASETILDYSLASGDVRFMSFRIKKVWDSMYE